MPVRGERCLSIFRAGIARHSDVLHWQNREPGLQADCATVQSDRKPIPALCFLFVFQ